MPNKKISKPGPSTQKFLDVAEVRDDMVILKDGAARAVLLVSSINFALKSEDEQEAIVQAYMGFLNSLEYPVQILIQSRKMNIDPYLRSLAEHRKSSPNELLRAQIDDYRDFISELVQMGEIMQKRFYLVVPYDPVSNKQKKFFSRLGEAVTPLSSARLNERQLRERVEQLARRTQLLSSLLSSMGLEVVRLDTQGLIELYYNAYNPEIADLEKLTDIDLVRTESISSV